MAGKTPAIRAVQEDCQWPLNVVEIPTGHMSPQYIADYPESTADEVSLSLYLDHPIKGHVSFLTNNPRATKLGLWISLDEMCWIWQVSLRLPR